MPPLDRSAIPRTFQQALAHQQAGRVDEARKLYRDILTAAPNLPEALFRLGELDLQAGRAAQGIKALERALTDRPSEPALTKALAQAYAAHPKEAAASTKRLAKATSPRLALTLLRSAADRLLHQRAGLAAQPLLAGTYAASTGPLVQITGRVEATVERFQ
jgi:predicted Zn-dependent protease